MSKEMSHGDSEEDKLAEEIGEILDVYLMVPGSSKGAKAYLPIAGAKHIITRIGKAYADGLPLPDEVERGWINADGMLLDAHGAIKIWDLEEDDTLIALRPGTGKAGE